MAAYFGAERSAIRFAPMALRVVRARLKHRIGPFHFSLLGLARVPERDWDTYIIMGPQFDASRNALSPGAIRGVIDNKLLFHAHCLRAGLPTIPIICRVGGQPDQRADVIEQVHDPARFVELMDAAPSELFIKPVDGAHGEGAFPATRRNGAFEFDGACGGAAQLFAHLQQRCGPNASMLVQPRIRCHDAMRPLGSDCGLPTVRVVTAMVDGTARILMACLRVPVGNSVTDNFGDGTTGNLVVGIDVESGVLMPARRSARRDWPVMVTVDAHPDTGFRFAGSQLPFWPEIVGLVLRAQHSLPDLKTIGWDVAATQQGVLLVELNSNYGVYSLQVAYQRGLKKELSRQLNITVD